MDVEEDLLIVDEVGVSSQQAGREQTSARPVFSDPERVYCRVADPGQERLRRSEGSGEDTPEFLTGQPDIIPELVKLADELFDQRPDLFAVGNQPSMDLFAGLDERPTENDQQLTETQSSTTATTKRKRKKPTRWGPELEIWMVEVPESGEDL
ncbi:hypothetical protein HELRODRAFT_184478 [Helobdella robusta]|uniref:Uncharacterized protein n=1 Tax=Helobdella robusta TaxID=6412 RepID=T1FLA4_HELRO|nr:hypothetical protein HELRODRAFT_184478 [Helobdella robusta]ESN94949.1 hypothetical protein HELRODRAFT_184478 [Helobdella robusta]